MVVNFVYPQLFETEYIILHVRLEIGPLAEWMDAVAYYEHHSFCSGTVRAAV